MRIFLTGATGFAGSHLVDRLLAQGHELFALVHDATSHQQLPGDPTSAGDSWRSLAVGISETDCGRSPAGCYLSPGRPGLSGPFVERSRFDTGG